MAPETRSARKRAPSSETRSSRGSEAAPALAFPVDSGPMATPGLRAGSVDSGRDPSLLHGPLSAKVTRPGKRRRRGSEESSSMDYYGVVQLTPVVAGKRVRKPKMMKRSPHLSVLPAPPQPVGGLTLPTVDETEPALNAYSQLSPRQSRAKRRKSMDNPASVAKKLRYRTTPTSSHKKKEKTASKGSKTKAELALPRSNQSKPAMEASNLVGLSSLANRPRRLSQTSQTSHKDLSEATLFPSVSSEVRRISISSSSALGTSAIQSTPPREPQIGTAGKEIDRLKQSHGEENGTLSYEKALIENTQNIEDGSAAQPEIMQSPPVRGHVLAMGCILLLLYTVSTIMTTVLLFLEGEKSLDVNRSIAIKLPEKELQKIIQNKTSEQLERYFQKPFASLENSIAQGQKAIETNQIELKVAVASRQAERLKMRNEEEKLLAELFEKASWVEQQICATETSRKSRDAASLAPRKRTKGMAAYQDAFRTFEDALTKLERSIEESTQAAKTLQVNNIENAEALAQLSKQTRSVDEEVAVVQRAVLKVLDIKLADDIGIRDLTQPVDAIDVFREPDRTSLTFAPECDVDKVLVALKLREKSLPSRLAHHAYCALTEHTPPPESIFMKTHPMRRCWTFNGTQGVVSVKFRHGPIPIRGLVLEHKARQLSPLHSILTMPTQVQLFGINTTTWEETSIVKLYVGPYTQIFHSAINQEAMGPFDGFKAIFLNKNGADYTCVHRLRIV